MSDCALTTTLEIVIPVLNEEFALPGSVETLHRFLSANLGGYRWRILIADNGSTDSTPEVCQELGRRLPGVEYLRLEQRGRGRALRTAWLNSDADILAYMDVDLSADLDGLPPLIDAVGKGGCALVIGSRLTKGAQVIGRPLIREIASRGYSFLFRAMFLTGFVDAQCGFKAISRGAANDLVPLVEDNGWFFDTELLVLAEKNGYRIEEVPVRWTDDPDSRVRLVSTAYGDVKGLLRLRFGGLRAAKQRLAESRGDA